MLYAESESIHPLMGHDTSGFCPKICLATHFESPGGPQALIHYLLLYGMCLPESETVMSLVCLRLLSNPNLETNQSVTNQSVSTYASPVMTRKISLSPVCVQSGHISASPVHVQSVCYPHLFVYSISNVECRYLGNSSPIDNNNDKLCQCLTVVF